MIGNIVPSPPNSLGPRGSATPSREELHRVMTIIQGLERLLVSGKLDVTQQRQASRSLADLRMWAREMDRRLKEAERTTNIGGNLTEVHADEAVVASGDAQIKVGHDLHIGHNYHYYPSPPQGPQNEMIDKTERAYLQWLLHQHSSIQLSSLHRQLGMSQDAPDIGLSDVFVHLDSLHTQDALDRDDNPDSRVPVPVLDVINRRDAVVILGDPGSGKTTLLNFLTYCLAGGRLYPLDGRYLDELNLEQQGGRPAVRWSRKDLLPVRVSLREFVQELPENVRTGKAKLLKDHILNQLREHSFDELVPRMTTALREGECLVMLDGLDEIADPKQRHIVRDTIHDFVSSHTGNKYIVTCRTLSYTDPDWQLRYKAVTLAPLSEASIDEFITRWYHALLGRGAIGEEKAAAKSLELRETVRYLADLATNPMLLTVICVIHTYWRLPRERARLYGDCVNLLLWKWTEPRLTPENGWEQGIIDVLGVREERLVSGLCALAFHMHSEQDRKGSAADISQSEVLGVLSDYLDGDEAKARQFCNYVEQQAGLLVGRGQPQGGEPTYAFPHRGFQEFLAACHIISQRNFASHIAELALKGDFWHEVLLLAIGHFIFNQKTLWPALEALNVLVKPSAPESPDDWRTVWLAGEMLNIISRSSAESDEHIGRHLVPLLLNQLVQLVTEGHLTPVERAKAGDALGRLGDPRPGVCTVEPVMVRFEGGPFKLGTGLEQHRVLLKPFDLARYPVTNAQFKMFLDEGYADDRYWLQGGLAWRERAAHHGGMVNDPRWGTDNRPVVGVTWHEMIAYVNWLRKATGKPYRLATEAEWERAAAGLERRKYPFGSRAGDEDVNTREAGVGQTTAVGIFPKDRTPEGLYDMGGNVWEWTSSLFWPYPYDAADGRERLGENGPRVLRGGAYDRDRTEMHCERRRQAVPRASVPLIGFRLARDVK